MTVAELITIRNRGHRTQSGMAESMGLSLRAYQDVEAKHPDTILSERHRLLAERASLTLALTWSDLDIAAPAIRTEAMAYVAMFRGTQAA